jgi:hypothetical protein
MGIVGGSKGSKNLVFAVAMIIPVNTMAIVEHGDGRKNVTALAFVVGAHELLNQLRNVGKPHSSVHALRIHRALSRWS